MATPGTLAKTSKMKHRRGQGHPNEFLNIFLIRMVIRIEWSSLAPAKTLNMRPGRGQGHPNEFLSTFLIRMLIRSGHLRHLGQNFENEALKGPGSPK